MRTSLFPIATAILGAALLTPTPNLSGQATAAPATVHHKKKHVVKKGPTVEEQIQSLRTDMQQQIQTLQQQLTASQSQLQQAQAAAAAAQQAAQQAQQQSAQQAQTLTDNTTAVTGLQSAVTDLKTSSSSLQTAVTEGQAKMTKAIEHPDALHYKGATISATGSYIDASTVDRTRATGGDIATSFTGIPLENTDQAKFTEFYGTGRQSRLALQVEGKLTNATLRAYYESDFLGVGVSSNNNQTNSYALRLRQAWGQAELSNGWTFSAGQMWTLATDYKQGLTLRQENAPNTIDPNNHVGWVWGRQYGARAVKSFNNKAWLGVSVENSQTLAPAGSGLPLNYLAGSAGANGGAYNGGGAPGATSSANLANYSFNLAPDLIAKMAFEPGYGHYEVFGIARFFRNRVYPNLVYTTTTITVPNPVAGGPGVPVTSTTITGTTAGAYNDQTVGGGVGGSFRLPIIPKKLNLSFNGIWGDGISRYTTSQIGDLTLRPDGQLALIHGASGQISFDYQVTPRLLLYGNYGEDEDFRRFFFTSATKAEGYGSTVAGQTGCFTEPAPSNTPTAGFSPGAQSGCTANTRALIQGTFGYWYDLYKGDKGRFRQGVQYSYFDRLTWSGAPNSFGRAPMGNDNMIETSFRYFLP